MEIDRCNLAFQVNYVPTWFPAPFRTVGNACRAATTAMIAEPFKMIEKRMVRTVKTTSNGSILTLVLLAFWEKYTVHC